MKTFEKQLSDEFYHASPQVDDSALLKTLLAAKSECEHTHHRHRIPFTAFLFRQVRYLFLPVWILQGAVLLVLIVMHAAYYQNMGYVNEEQIAVILCCSMILILFITIPFVMRSLWYKMYEIEAASRFSVGQLLLTRLIAIGLGDLIMCIGIFVFTKVQTSLSVVHIILYLGFPFLVLSSAALGILKRFPISKYAAGCICAGAAVFVFTCLTCDWIRHLDEQAFRFITGSICIVLALYLAFQMKRTVRDCREGRFVNDTL